MTASALLCLLMTTTIANSDGDPSWMRTIATVERKGAQTIDAPEKLYDSRLAALTLLHPYSPNGTEPGISIQVGGPKYSQGRRCSYPSEIAARPYTIRRLNKPYIVVVVQSHDFHEYAKLLVVNMDTCELSYEYDGDLPADRMLFFTNNTFGDPRFTVIVGGKNFCQGHEWCRLYFNLRFEKLESLDLDFPVNRLYGIESATNTVDSNLLIARFNNEDDNQIIRLYDFSANRTGSLYRDLLVLPKDTSIEAVDGLSYCWRVNQELDDSSVDGCYNVGNPNVVHCAKYKKNGSLIFSRSVVFPDRRKVLTVQTLPNALVLFSITCDCLKSNICKAADATLITHVAKSKDSKQEVEIQNRRYAGIDCYIYPSSLKFQYNSTTNIIEGLQHICSYDSYLVHRIVYEYTKVEL